MGSVSSQPWPRRPSSWWWPSATIGPRPSWAPVSSPGPCCCCTSPPHSTTPCHARVPGPRLRRHLSPHRRYLHAVYTRSAARRLGMDAVRFGMGHGARRCRPQGDRRAPIPDPVYGALPLDGVARPHRGSPVVAPRAGSWPRLAIGRGPRLYRGCRVLRGRAAAVQPLPLASVRARRHQLSLRGGASVRGLTRGWTSRALGRQAPERGPASFATEKEEYDCV